MNPISNADGDETFTMLFVLCWTIKFATQKEKRGRNVAEQNLLHLFFKTQGCAAHEKRVFLNSRDDQRERAGTGVWYYERLAWATTKAFSAVRLLVKSPAWNNKFRPKNKRRETWIIIDVAGLFDAINPPPLLIDLHGNVVPLIPSGTHVSIILVDTCRIIGLFLGGGGSKSGNYV